MFLSLWPLRYVNPIADDLHLLTQGVGLIRTRGFFWVLNEWSDFGLDSSHITPLGGLWSTLHIWVLDLITSNTPLTIGTVWGFLRVAWITAAIMSVCLFLRTVGSILVLTPLTPLIGLSVLLSTIQVHGYWSNDPVTAFPIASWAFCIIGFLFLSSVIQIIKSNSARYGHILIATCLAIVGVLTYELFIAFLLAAIVYLALQWIVDRFPLSLFFLTSLPVVIIPVVFLFVTQFLRLSQGSSYSGTDIALGSESFPKISAVALFSSLPLTNIPLTQELLRNETAPFSFMFPFLGGLLILIITTLVLKNRWADKATTDQPISRLVPLFGAMITIWIVATAVIIATPKYQSELAGQLGKVYVNYAPSWLALGVFFTVIAGYLIGRFPKVGLYVFFTLIVVIGTTQVVANTKQISILARDSSWSTKLLELLKSDIVDGEQRCSQFNRLFGLPFPEYYQLEIFNGLQMAYQGSNGVSYCDFEGELRTTPSMTRSLGGTFPIELLPDNRNIFWANDTASALQVIYFGENQFSGYINTAISLPACAEETLVSVRLNDFNINKNILPGEEIDFPLPVTAQYGDTFMIEIDIGNAGCLVANDARKFFAMINEPKMLKNQN